MLKFDSYIKICLWKKNIKKLNLNLFFLLKIIYIIIIIIKYIIQDYLQYIYFLIVN